MNRIINKYIGFLILPVFLITACDDDDHTGFSKLTPTNPTVTINVPAQDISFAEQDTTFQFEVTLSEPQIVDVAININILEGTATDHEDFAVENTDARVFIPAGSTSGIAEITFLADDETEPAETISIQIGDASVANASITPITVNFTILPWLEVKADWGGSYMVGDEELNYNDAVDFDFFLFDADGNEVTGYAAATGAAPEAFSLSPEMPDGTYELLVNPYAIEDFEGEGIPEDELPITLTFTRLPNEYTSVYNEFSTYDDELFLDNSGNENYYHLANIIKTGNNFEIVDAGGTSLGSLRKSVRGKSRIASK